jgi:hypothetical protein
VNGLHGVVHWARVLRTGFVSARPTARIEVITLFAQFDHSRVLVP